MIFGLSYHGSNEAQVSGQADFRLDLKSACQVAVTNHYDIALLKELRIGLWWLSKAIITSLSRLSYTMAVGMDMTFWHGLAITCAEGPFSQYTMSTEQLAPKRRKAASIPVF